MNHFRQWPTWLVLVAAGAILISLATAQNATNISPPLDAASAPAMLMPSPMAYFRGLLAMSPQQREKVLARKPPEIRARILAKINEYAALDPDERELRLRATELRWFLVPLLHDSPKQRAAQLAMVPESIRGLVQSRLMQWEILPPQLQQEFLENEHVLSYFSEVNATDSLSDGVAPSDAEQSRWNALSDGRKQAMVAQFNEFIEMSPLEKQRALGELSDDERQQMEKALQTFDKLPPLQRLECIHAFGEFASMSAQDRAEFLQNAQRWSQMTASERKAWRDLVAHVPLWPPLPPAMIMPPMPQNVRAVVATNHG